MQRLVRSTIILSCCGLLSCSGSDVPDDIGGGNPDGGQADSGQADTGMTGADAGEADVGEPDAGSGACASLGTALQAQTAPERRGDMAFAHDPTCDRVFMFSGDQAEPVMCGPAASRFLGDLHTLDVATGQWTLVEVTPGGPAPRERARSSGLWDSKRDRFIVFGGRWRMGTSGQYTFLNDVWAFDPATKSWTELSPHGNAGGRPLGRMNTVIDYDPTGDRMIIVAGGRVSSDFQSFPVDNQVWAFNFGDNSWENLWNDGSTGPDPRLFHEGALDRANGRFFIHGGGKETAFTDLDFLRDTWFFDLNNQTWTEVPQGMTCQRDVNCFGDPCVEGLCSTPRGRIKGAMTYDPARNRILMFGGHDDRSLGNVNDLWALDLADPPIWVRIEENDTFNRGALGFCDFPADFANVVDGTPERRESHLWIVAGDTAILYGGRTDCGLSNDTWRFDLTTGTWQELNPSFNGMTCFRSGRTDCNEPDARKCG